MPSFPLVPRRAVGDARRAFQAGQPRAAIVLLQATSLRHSCTSRPSRPSRLSSEARRAEIWSSIDGRASVFIRTFIAGWPAAVNLVGVLTRAGEVTTVHLCRARHAVGDNSEASRHPAFMIGKGQKEW